MAFRKSLRKYTFFQRRDRHKRTLPNELIEAVLSHLEFVDLLNVMLVCKTLHRRGNTNFLWKNLFMLHYLVEISSTHAKRLFILHNRCERLLDGLVVPTLPKYEGILFSFCFPENMLVIESSIKIFNQLLSLRKRKSKSPNKAWIDYLLAKFLIYIPEIFTRGKDLDENLNFYITSALSLNNPNALFLSYLVSTALPSNERQELLLKAHNNGCYHATLLHIIQLRSMSNLMNTRHYLLTMIDRHELLIKEASRGNPGAAFLLGETYLDSINRFIEYFVNPVPITNPISIAPCTEQEWGAYKEMLDNSDKVIRNRNFKLDEKYKTTLFFGKKIRFNALDERKKHALYWFKKASDKNIPKAAMLYEELENQDLHHVINILQPPKYRS